MFRWLQIHRTLLIVAINVAFLYPADLRSESPDQTIKVAVCQTLCLDSDKSGNLKRIEYALMTASEQGAQLACFPETSILGWVNPDAHQLADPIPGETSNHLSELARKYELMICIGLCEKEGEKLFDSVILIDASGEILYKHRKINTLSNLMEPPYTSGNAEDIKVVDTEIGRVGILICADVFQQENVEVVSEQSPDIMLIPFGWAAEKDAWPEHGKSLTHWVSSVAKRTNCPVVGTDLVGMISSGPWKGYTYGGQSLVVDQAGEVLGTLQDRDAEVRIIELEIAD